MNKKIIIFSVVLALALALSACAEKPVESQPLPSGSEAEPTKEMEMPTSPEVQPPASTEQTVPEETVTDPAGDPARFRFSVLISKEDFVNLVLQKYGTSSVRSELEGRKQDAFTHYDGSPVQIWKAETDEIQLLYAPVLVFYRAGEDMTPAQIASEMFAAYLEELKDPETSPNFTVLRYELAQPECLTEEEVREKLRETAETFWQNNAEKTVPEGTDWAAEFCLSRLLQNGCADVPEGWYAIPVMNGWYEFEGKDFVTFEELKAETPAEQQQDGMVPFFVQSEGYLSYVQMQQDGVWCLMPVYNYR